ncbi:DUF5810 domain-containing protein [Halogeometricum limi]|uniref:Uncharacterized protein n=1 Tax=Halogeometricum limi TaxID=555875 RepID=A0A1I6H8J5_9EURY|nr:DUF5810 domain-containing protein [Halogeometricum limi]SFR50795.1 hypothetical protein SAMN04488124_1920 [Halogeometricum limi]
MGYACPVCDVPQQDAEHLANHLAFTAMTHGGDHESWLDEHVPDWSTGGPAELGPKVTELAEETEYDAVFEDTVHDHAPHDHDSLFDEEAGGETPSTGVVAQREPVDDETQAVLDEARAMTREMLGGSADGADGADDTDDVDADADSADGADGADGADDVDDTGD